MTASPTAAYQSAAELSRSGVALYPVTERVAAPVVDRSSGRARGAGERTQILANPGFGRYFTDHLVRATWSADGGWTAPELVDYEPQVLDPASMFVHYGQSIFEGLKAYRHADGALATFRPEANAARMQRSARRLAMAEVPQDLFLGAVEALVHAEADWIVDEKLPVRFQMQLHKALWGEEQGK